MKLSNRRLSVRKQVWGARLILVLPQLALIGYVMQIHIKGTHLWLFGHPHILGLMILALLAYPVIGIPLLGLAIWTFATGCQAFEFIWRTAWRMPRAAWKDRWKVEDGRSTRSKGWLHQ